MHKYMLSHVCEPVYGDEFLLMSPVLIQDYIAHSSLTYPFPPQWWETQLPHHHPFTYLFSPIMCSPFKINVHTWEKNPLSTQVQCLWTFPFVFSLTVSRKHSFLKLVRSKPFSSPSVRLCFTCVISSAFHLGTPGSPLRCILRRYKTLRVVTNIYWHVDTTLLPYKLVPLS